VNSIRSTPASTKLKSSSTGANELSSNTKRR
jgi:hypothetical protein